MARTKKNTIECRKDPYFDKIHLECDYTGTFTCSACPYVVYDEDGSPMCYKDTYEHCKKGDLDEYFVAGDGC